MEDVEEYSKLRIDLCSHLRPHVLARKSILLYKMKCHFRNTYSCVGFIVLKSPVQKYRTFQSFPYNTFICTDII